MNIKESMDEVITLSSGRLRGIRQAESETISWLGIPYAKPPVDKLRWKAPREVEPWEGILPVLDFNHNSVQVFQGVPNGSEDCLYLNVWRPDHTGINLPVFVFLHGGGNTSGSGRDFQGGMLARETNCIVITLNYRLGAMGFFRHPALRNGDPFDDSGNYGLLDILHALKWVQKNIVSFGGDPGNVTLAGQSAGARNALAAYLSPLGKGLFHKLFVLSGGLTTVTSEQGEAKAFDILCELLWRTGVVKSKDDALDWISKQSADSIADFLYHQDASKFADAIGETGLRMTAFPHLFEDGTVIPRGGFDHFKNSEQTCLPVVLGSTASEFSVFALMDPYFLPQIQAGQLAENMEKNVLYEAAVQYGSELYAAFNVEQVAEEFMDAIPKIPIFAYRFGWGLHDGVIDPSLRFLIGASHGADLPFYTGDFSFVEQNFPKGTITENNEPGRRALTTIMRGYLGRFLYSGDPNGEGLPTWKRWTISPQSNEILSLGASKEEAIVQSHPKLSMNEILSRMDHDARLSAEQRSWLKTQLFAGRFFCNC
ncbi:carboxylesterase/lipase family protein [Cohnella boryungensis]|uniref:Carboxylic ester hydrolase n=1 Tax=Cohnella boryungensis TaxID=768479 RepID=A0ABV8SFW8_9BACL